MRKRLIGSLAAMAALSILLALLAALPAIRRAFAERAFAELRAAAVSLGAGAGASGDAEGFLRGAAERLPGMRLSLIDEAGRVRYDSGVAAEKLPNHAERPEVALAAADGEGTAIRHSDSLGEDICYFAVRLADGEILRLARRMEGVRAEVWGLLPSFAAVALLVLGIATLAAGRLTRRFMRPIDALALHGPSGDAAYAELAPLYERIEKQRTCIQQQMRESREHARQLATIMQDMAEGLVILSGEGKILSLNASAARLLGEPGRRYTGQHYLSLARSLPMHDAAGKALAGERAFETMEIKGRICQVLASPVHEGEAVRGAMLMLLDVTERSRTEQMRREFTANVSHELRSPLTTIAGYAEMMHLGVSGAEDAQVLAGNILSEARRLLSLIEDILALSRLDEMHAPVEAEPVDIKALAQETARRLAPMAAEKGIAVTVEGDACQVMGMLTLLSEMIRNLVDNAIRYNAQGGWVRVQVSCGGDGVSLAVEDGGPGIGPEHHDRIFERFYRVDKSHSRQTGGTGLGLAIVKHCALVHGGRVSLWSEAGVGSRFTVWLPGEAPGGCMQKEDGGENGQTT